MSGWQKVRVSKKKLANRVSCPCSLHMQPRVGAEIALVDLECLPQVAQAVVVDARGCKYNRR